MRRNLIKHTVTAVEEVLKQAPQLNELIAAIRIDRRFTGFAVRDEFVIPRLLETAFAAKAFGSDTALQDVHDGVEAALVGRIEGLAFFQTREAARHESHVSGIVATGVSDLRGLTRGPAQDLEIR